MDEGNGFHVELREACHELSVLAACVVSCPSRGVWRC